jgi:PTS system nitrogen regulatory IIA component
MGYLRSPDMRIAEFLLPDCIVPVLAATSKEAVIRELAVTLAKSIPSVSAERLFNVLLEREKVGSTGMEKGVAIPHARLPELPTLVACFGVSKPGIAFDARDERPSHFFFALVAPENSAGLHLKALSKISRLFRSDTLRDRILAASSAAEIYSLINAEDTPA